MSLWEKLLDDENCPMEDTTLSTYSMRIVHVHMQAHICIHARTQACKYMYVYTHIRVHARMQANTHASTHADTQANVHARKHARMHACRHTDTASVTVVDLDGFALTLRDLEAGNIHRVLALRTPLGNKPEPGTAWTYI